VGSTRFGSVILASAFLAWGCSSGSTGKGTGSGGSTGTGTGGSAPGTGGTTATGGSAPGTGGAATGTGGTSTGTGTGGTQATGGTIGSGGSGAAGRGGSAGNDGTGHGGSAGAGTGGSGGAGTGSGGASPGGVTVQLDQKRQTIEGFGLNTALGGGTFNWDNLFGTSGADGIGLSIVRVGMNSDGSLSGDVSGAKSHNVKIIGSVWTAPAAWKDNNNESKGGHLLSAHYDEFATRIATFAKNQGLYAMSAANEPDFASCGSTIGPPCNGDYVTMVYTANEMVKFVNVLGPKLKANGVKLMAPEPSEWLHLWSNASATGSTVSSHVNSSDPLGCGCFSNNPTTTGCASKCSTGEGYDYGHWLAKDPTAWPAIDILATHEYDTQKAEPWPADVDGGKRSKEVWETEVSGVMYWPEQGPSSDINNGIVVAGWIHSALVVGEASAWLYWWYKPTGNDNEGIVLSSGGITKRYYTIGNYSKFVRPGYVMVDVTGNTNANVLLSAFTGTDGTVVVAVNKSTSAVTMPINIAGGTAPASCTPNVTSSSDNLKAGTAVTVTGGAFTASLGASTVTTFVCK
jgi:glucuronoarabinoxylan endo-1,4-beta-xylanase